jgi:hypothetical protein
MNTRRYFVAGTGAMSLAGLGMALLTRLGNAPSCQHQKPRHRGAYRTCP